MFVDETSKEGECYPNYFKSDCRRLQISEEEEAAIINVFIDCNVLGFEEPHYKAHCCRFQ